MKLLSSDTMFCKSLSFKASTVFFGLAPALLACLVSTAGFAQDAEKQAEKEAAKPLPPIEYSGYWRLGYNTDINPLQANQSTQGTSVPTSRHIRDSSYLNLGLGKTFENVARVQIVVDHSGSTPHQDGQWSPSTPAGLAKRDFTIRDLYLELPVGEAKIWAGAKRLEWEDIRILDYGNPFNVNGYGLGASFSGTTAALTVEDRGIKTVVAPAEGAPANTAPTTPDLPVKDVTLVARHEVSLGEKRAIKPMLLVKQYGGAQKNEDVGQPEIKGATAFKIGGIYSSWSDTHWANVGVWFESNPVDVTGTASGTNTSVGIMASDSYEFGEFGVLAGVLVKHDSLKNSEQELKIADDKKGLEVDGDKKTSNRVNASIAVQPVYYATSNLHLALDLNYALTTKKFGTVDANGTVSSSDANGIFVTPIVRYAMAKNTLGTPQIYTSITYGNYDWKVKKNAKGEATDTLITTQTGFEVWF